MTPTLTLVIPLRDEDESLTELVRQIDAARAGRDWRTILIDDGSNDNSWSVVEKLSAEHPWVEGVKFRRNFGKAAALACGFARAEGHVITLDADLQDDPAEIPRFLVKMDEGFDLISGWKKIRHDPWHKVFPSRVFNWMVSKATGVKLHDHNCGMKLYRQGVVESLNVYGERHRFLPVFAASRGFKVGELVIAHRARQYGASKYGFRRLFKGFVDLIAVTFLARYAFRPMHFFAQLAIVFGLTALAGLAVDVWAEPAWISALGGLVANVFGIGTIGAMFAGLTAEFQLHVRDLQPPYAVVAETGTKKPAA